MPWPEKTKIKPSKKGSKKKTRERLLYDFAYFVIVLTIAAFLLSYLMEVRPEMSFERQTVAYHTSAVLNVFGAETWVYENVVRVPHENPQKAEIVNTLVMHGFDSVSYSDGAELRARELSPESQKIVDTYLASITDQGLPVYISKATVFVDAEDFIIEADIAPECVGWIGMFAIFALIIAYPRVSAKKRVFGIVIALPLMYLMNIARVSTTIYAGYSAGPGVMDFTHDFLWRTVLIIWALILWVFWIYFIVEDKKLWRKKK